LDHSGTQNPGVGRAYRDQPNPVDFARLGEGADLKQCDRSGGEYRGSEDHQVFRAAWWWLHRRSRSFYPHCGDNLMPFGAALDRWPA